MTNVPAGLTDRFDEAIEAQKKHITVARALISRALSLINRAEAGDKSISVDDLMKATACLEKGTKMETRANEVLIKLTKERPR